MTLAADVFFVDGTGFLMTVLRNIKFITAEYVTTRTVKNLSIHMDRVTQVYKRDVRTILMDGEFEKKKEFNATGSVQYDGGKGTCKRGGAKHSDNQGVHAGNHRNPAFRVHPKTTEDGDNILRRAVAQRFPGEDGSIKCALATRITRALEAGLCQALPCAPRDVL